MVEIAEPTDDISAEGVTFDHWSAKMTYSPWDVWSQLRNDCPVAHTESHEGYYILSRYEDVYAAALNVELFSSDGGGNGVSIPPQEVRPLYPVDLDPPAHSGYRTLLNPLFSVRSVARFEPWIRTLHREYIAKFPSEGVFDIATDFTMITPRLVAFHVLGFPPEDLGRISGYIDRLAFSNAGSERSRKGSAPYAHRDDLRTALRIKARRCS